MFRDLIGTTWLKHDQGNRKVVSEMMRKRKKEKEKQQPRTKEFDLSMSKTINWKFEKNKEKERKIVKNELARQMRKRNREREWANDRTNTIPFEKQQLEKFKWGAASLIICGFLVLLLLITFSKLILAKIYILNDSQYGAHFISCQLSCIYVCMYVFIHSFMQWMTLSIVSISLNYETLDDAVIPTYRCSVEAMRLSRIFSKQDKRTTCDVLI